MRNKFEQRIHDELKGAKVKAAYESEKIPYVIHGRYIPDFILTTKTGKKIYLECKGYLRPEHKRKMVAVKRQHTDLDLRILFYASNKKNSKWAIKHGFKYAIGSIPKEWLEE